MKIFIMALALAFTACIEQPAIQKAESSLCTIDDQLAGGCFGPFSLLPQHTLNYAGSSAPAGAVMLEDTLWCAQASSNVTCGVQLTVPGYTIRVTCWIEEDHPNWPPECRKEMIANIAAPIGDPNFCTIQDQLDGRCQGPFTLLAAYTRDYAATIDPSQRNDLNCYRSGTFSQCSLFVDVPGYTIVVLCGQYDGDPEATCTTSVVK